jgi:DNA-binding CsgD family transcriptional regulator
MIGVAIEHIEPLLIKILKVLQHLPLSPMQKEVAALVAQGFSNDKISQHLHIKVTTVKEYINLIFIKLDIDRREELLPILEAMEKSDKQFII